MKRIAFVWFVGTTTLLLSTSGAYAYLDPGTGSIILQGLLAGIAGGLVVIKLYWGKLKSLFASGSRKKEHTQDPAPHADKQ